MIYFVGGMLAIGLLWWVGKNYESADPKQLAALIRRIGGWIIIAFAGFLLLRGRLDLAFLVGGAGWWMVQGQRLDAYLNSRFSFGRKDAYRDANTGPIEHMRPREMTEEEALEILGLQAGATEMQIRDVHRKLMKKLHPDQGGTNYLAIRVNQAKDILLSRHR